MSSLAIALFGEAEKGSFETPSYCQNLFQLVDQLGNPPQNSQGLFYAVQALLYHHHLLFFRVREEGFSQSDYFSGLRLLQKQDVISQVAAICLPGVGDVEIIEAMVPLCIVYHRILITTESDLYDYMTSEG